EVLHLEQASVVVSLDRDFVGDDPDRVRNMRGFAAARQVLDTHSPMSRIYMVESTFSITGAKADHRWAVAPSAIPAYAVALARAIAAERGQAMPAGVAAALGGVQISPAIRLDERAVAEMAKDLIAAGAGKSLVVAGPTQ